MNAGRRTPALSRAFFAAVATGLIALAWAHRFVQDDAFITFRYARHLVEGYGPVCNAGERVEGYSNFLWTLIVAGGMGLGAEPVAFTQSLGIALFAASLWLTWRLSIAAGLPEWNALAVVAAAGTNFTFSSYATGGLETPLVTALFLGVMLGAVRWMNGAISRGRLLAILSVLFTAAVMTRLDSPFLLALPAAVALGADASGGTLRWRRPSAGEIATFATLPALLIGSWLAWKWSFYGDLLPRSFYLKAVNPGSLDRGLRYFYEFVASYWLAPFLVLAMYRFGALFRKGNGTLLLLAATVAVWCAYVLKMGGDFMEYRFLVPVIPLAMLLLLRALAGLPRPRLVVAAGLVLLMAGSTWHATRFRYDRETGVEPVAMLEGHLSAPDENWIGIGKALAETFRREDGVVIATTAAGAIPYYSGLRTVDMLGLTEPSGVDSADENPGGVLVGTIPGHQRVLDYDDLVRRGVHLVISHPIVWREGDPPPPLPLLPKPSSSKVDATLVAMPLGDGYRLLMLSIRPNSAVDTAVSRRGWEARPVSF